MDITLRRTNFTERSTIGELLINGVHQCYTLEDKMREQPGVPVERWKAHGKTAIPTGRYQVVITHSARFDRDLPLLVAVPGFDGIRIHPGNTDKDTEGCILVGLDRGVDQIGQSRAAFTTLFTRLRAASGPLWITITNEEAD